VVRDDRSVRDDRAMWSDATGAINAGGANGGVRVRD